MNIVSSGLHCPAAQLTWKFVQSIQRRWKNFMEHSSVAFAATEIIFTGTSASHKNKKSIVVTSYVQAMKHAPLRLSAIFFNSLRSRIKSITANQRYPVFYSISLWKRAKSAARSVLSCLESTKIVFAFSWGCSRDPVEGAYNSKLAS